MSIETVLTAYIECALWSSNDESDESGGDPMDANYSRADIAMDAHHKMAVECRAFLDEIGALADEWDDEQVGHDFWLTRNGHGTGFGDRDLPNADALADIARSYGECHLYVGDDGKIYAS